MRGHFSIEWMAQSSQQQQQQETPRRDPNLDLAPRPTTCGTHAESLPGFYCRTRAQNPQEQDRNQEQQDFTLSSLQHQTSHNNNQGPEADFSSSTEEETSGYESEGGRSSVSPSTPADCTSSSTSSCPTSPPASPPSGRRPRTAFTTEQISSMERAFKRNAYLGTQDKAELCKKLNLSDKQIRNWFQNRRMKLKRTVQDALAHACQANVASQLLHYPELQAYRAAPYPRYHHHPTSTSTSTTTATAVVPPTAAGQEGPASYVPHSLQYASPLPLDSFYQYSALPGVMLPPYPSYPQYY